MIFLKLPCSKKKKKKNLLQNPNQQNNTPHQKLISRT